MVSLSFIYASTIKLCSAHHISLHNCLDNFGTINRTTVRPFGTQDKGYKSGTVPEIPGQLEPMLKLESLQ